MDKECQNMNQILEQVDLRWPKDKIIRFLYVKLAPFFERDLDYFLGDADTQFEIYQNGFKQNSHLVVCKTLSEWYQKIYASFHIQSQVIQTNQKRIPHYALIVEGDKGWYYLDPLKDLFSNQLGLKSNFFGVTPVKYNNVANEFPFLIDLPFAYVQSIDRDLHLNFQGYYMDTFFDMLHMEITSNQVCDFFCVSKNDQFELMRRKLDFIEQHLINMGSIPGLYERNTFYHFLIFYVFNRRERKFISSEINFVGTGYQLELTLLPKQEKDTPIYFVEGQNENGDYCLKKKK